MRNEMHVSGSATSSRRGFLAATAAVGAAALPTIVSARALGLGEAAAASERITLGVIGMGPRATHVVSGMMKLPDLQVVAIADVQAARRDKGKALVDETYGTKDCMVYRDFRELIARKDIDAVLVATGDRWHATASIMAAEAGKDVYSEKPCGLTIDLCQRLADTIKKTGRVYQAGTQRRSVPNWTAAVKLAQTGRLGKLKSLHASIYEPKISNDWLPAEKTPPPDTCDWNLWLGIAPWRPYNAQYVQGKWRGVHDFDAGAQILEWGVHTADLCQWANSADGTTPLEYEPREDSIVCRYANGVELVLDYLKTPFGVREPKFNTKLGTCPAKFVGESAWVATGDSRRIDLSDESLRAEVPAAEEKPEQFIAAKLHSRNFVDCIKSRQSTVCNADVMRKSHITCHAAATSWILGRKLMLDPVRELFVTADGRPDNEANRFRSRPERNPWA